MLSARSKAASALVLIIQNNIGNAFSPTVTIAIITSSPAKKDLPTHVVLKHELPKKSIVMLEQLRTIDKKRLGDYITKLGDNVMKKVERGIKIELNLT